MPPVTKAEALARAEFLAEALGDFGMFCSLLDIIPKDKSVGKKKFQLNQIQKIFNIDRVGRDIVLKPRQIGFSTLELARDVFYFVTQPGAHVLVLCQSEADNGPLIGLSETVSRYLESLRRAGLKLNFAAEARGLWEMRDRDASLRIKVAGASEASARKAGRSGCVDRLHCTETSVWEFAEETLNAALECVPIGGEIVIESTPQGAAGLFFDYCQDAQREKNGFKFHFYPWFRHDEYQLGLTAKDRVVTTDGVRQLAPTDDDEQNSREATLVKLGVTPEQMKWYRQKVSLKGPDKTDQEYPRDSETCFLVSGSGFFDRAVTKRRFDELVVADPRPTKFGTRGTRIWEPPISGVRYLLSVDTSEGGGGDPSGGIVYRIDTGDHVATISAQLAPYELAEEAAALGKHYNIAVIVVERNNHGHSCLQALEREEHYPRIYIHDDKKPGWPTTQATRPAMLDALHEAYVSNAFKTRDRELLQQCRTFIVGPPPLCKPQAQKGAHDDLVMAAAIGWAVRLRHRTADLAVGGVGSHARSWGGSSGASGWGVARRPGW